ncbi:MAG: single-stranded-DNA-specific exonuclease RecJ [Cyanobacteriota bacterium]|nr:single-stranded-DNA-specific exonuclease RecJ [Cyanobacteriota bacterium]
MQSQWQLHPIPDLPEAFVDAVKREAVKREAPTSDCKYAAQLLWQRGIQDPAQLPGFLDPEAYQPSSPFEFGQEMKWAVQRLVQARDRGENVTIWGDFDADGVTSTSVLWEGLGQFFPQQQQLKYYIPNRFTESHGLNDAGIERLAADGTTLIVTCDTGSTNLSEINYANSLGLDIIVTDHHALPSDRPDVIAILNPRYFAEYHPLYHLSGVAVAYKLVEAMYATLPDIPQQPLEDLLDLVAIGLIADLVRLSGDCRYLAQRGIKRLQEQTRTRTRPGVAKLLELCRRTGDRPTDISFGLGPRINAVSRIHGDAHFCVELLTSRDPQRCKELAMETELANARRKELQKNVEKSVKQRLEQVDLSTSSIIVLEDAQWSGGVLGLVAGQIAQEYGRPAILLSTGEEETEESTKLARGSARSVGNIDLYELVKSQEQLLHRFGGHPFAAGLSLPVENIPLFRDAIDRQLKAMLVEGMSMQPTLQADLTVTVAELGKALFQELSFLEPCGMGNPVPKLLIQNCWFENVWNKNNVADVGEKKVQVRYIKTHFKICDDSHPEGFPGVWWGHYREDLPHQKQFPQDRRCDAIAELDFNSHPSKMNYEIRLVAVRLAEAEEVRSPELSGEAIADWRGCSNRLEAIADSYVVLQDCPMSWNEVRRGVRSAIAQSRTLALAYPPPPSSSPEQVWLQLVGIAKHLSRTGETATLEQIEAKLGLSRPTVEGGLSALQELGFEVERDRDRLTLRWPAEVLAVSESAISSFLARVEEEQFKRQYFYQIPLETVRAMVGS